LNEVRAKARIMANRFAVKLIIIDYIQLMSLGARAESRALELAKISMGIKNSAKQLNIPILVLSQLNREVDRSDRRPRLSDLRECGSLEQDGDTVILLYQPSSAKDDDSGMVNLMVAKQRNGPTGELQLAFLKEITRFESAAKIAEDDVPEQNALPYKD
jgi:replicative DNA helicase